MHEIQTFLFSLSIESNSSIDQVISGRRHVGIMSAEPVGNYGVRYYYNSIDMSRSFSYRILMALLLVIDVDYFLMTCIKRGSLHGITFIILEAISFPSWETTSKLWGNMGSVGTRQQRSEVVPFKVLVWMLVRTLICICTLRFQIMQMFYAKSW